MMTNAQKPAAPFRVENGITAHRGDSTHHPQNTLRVFSAANAIGVDWIETDDPSALAAICAQKNKDR
jgi:hypothetical protein